MTFEDVPLTTEEQEELTLWQAVRRWPRVTLYCLALSLNLLVWGYDTGLVGSVSSMPEFQKVFGAPHGDKYIIPQPWYSLFGVAFPIGSMIGAASGGWLQDVTGRRSTLALGGFLSIAAITTCYLADLAAYPGSAFFGGKLFEGVAVGMIICSTQTYMSEVVPTRLRAPVLALFPAIQMFGQLVSSMIVLGLLNVPGKTSYRIAIALQWPFSAVPLLLAFFVPESPSWLLQKDRYSKALASFQKIYGQKGSVSNNSIFDSMSQAVQEEQELAHSRSNAPTYIDCLRGANLRRTLISVFAVILPELFGMHLLGNASYFLQQVGLAASTGMIVTILGVIVGLIANFVSFWTLGKFGRRSLINSTLAIVVVLWLAIGIAGCFKGMGVAWFTVVGMILVITIAGVGVWPASYVVSSETSSLKLRSKTQGLTWIGGGAVKCGFDLGMPYVYNADAANLGAKTAFVFFGTTLLALVVAWFGIPELKGRSPVDVDRLFELRLPAWRFENHMLKEYESSIDEPFVALRYGGQLTKVSSHDSRESED